MTIQDIIHQDKPVLVDFYASWCHPCNAQLPILEELEARLGDSASILKIDVDEHKAIAEHYKIRSIPTLIIFKNGEVRWRQVGVFPANELERLLKENL